MRRSLSSPESPSARGRQHGGVLGLLIVILTVIVVIAMIALMIYVSMFVKAVEKSIDEAVKNLYVTEPARIQRLQERILEITIPPEFAPLQAYSILQATSVGYHWCPSRNCRSTNPSLLTLLSFPDPTSEDAPDWETLVQNQLSSRFSNYVREDLTFQLPHQLVRFAFVSVYDDDTPMAPASIETDANDDRGATAMTADAMMPQNVASRERVRLWWIHGEVQGKCGRCSIELQLKPEVYNQQQIITMIQSIR